MIVLLDSVTALDVLRHSISRQIRSWRKQNTKRRPSIDTIYISTKFLFASQEPSYVWKCVFMYEDRITQLLSIIFSTIYRTACFGQLILPPSSSPQIHKTQYVPYTPHKKNSYFFHLKISNCILTNFNYHYICVNIIPL